MRKNLSTEFKVGIFTVIGLLFVVALGIHFSRASSEVKGKNYYLLFDFLNGLQNGSAVRYSGGILVGKVLSIEPYKNRAKVLVVVNNKISVDNFTKFSIMSNGFLGEKYVNITLTAPDNQSERIPVKEDSTIEGVQDAGLDKLLSGVTALAEEMSKVMVPLAQILTKLQETNELPKLLASLHSLIHSGTQVINANQDKIAGIMTNIRSIIAKIDRGQGVLGKLVNDPTLAQSLSDVLDNIDVLIGKLSNNPLINRKNNYRRRD